ncbi:MAG: hypothetical protein ABJB03_01705 [Rhodoglobus sp.]
MLTLVVGIAASSTPGSDFQSSTAIASLALVPFAVWLTAGLLNSESDASFAVAAVGSGSAVRYRAFSILSIVALTVPLVLFSTVLAWARDKHALQVSVTHILVGLLAQFAAVLMGCALGALVSRPIVTRVGVAWIVGVLLSLSAITLPGSPVRTSVSILISDSPADASNYWWVLVIELALTTLFFVGGLRLFVRRL